MLRIPQDVARQRVANAGAVRCGHMYPDILTAKRWDESCEGEFHAMNLIEQLLERKMRTSKTSVGRVFYVEGKTFSSLDELDQERLINDERGA